MLDRERADFFRTLERSRPRSARTSSRPRSRSAPSTRSRGADRPRRHEGLRVRRTRAATTAARSRSRTTCVARRRGVPREADGRGRRGLRHAHGALPRGRGDLATRRSSTALKEGTNHGGIFPVTCGVATRNLGTNRLLDAIDEDLPSPVKHGALELPEITLEPDPDAPLYAYVFKTQRRPVRRAHQLLPRLPGHDAARQPRAQHARPRQGAARPAAAVPGQGERAAPTGSARATSAPSRSSRRRARATGSPTATSRSRCRRSSCPQPVMAFAMEPKTKGDEDKVFTALRRLQEEDPTIDLHRDQQTGEQIVAGLSQVHVEVIVDRLRVALRRRGDAEAAARALPGDDPRRRPRPTGATRSRAAAAASSATATSILEPLRRTGTSSSSTRSRAASSRRASSPRSRRACTRRCSTAPVAGFPVKGARVRLVDGSYHSVDSSEMAFKLAGSIAMREALGNAEPGAAGADHARDAVGARRRASATWSATSAPGAGTRSGMEPVGGATEIKAEVPMAEMLTYAPGPAVDHRRPRRLHDGVPALRGGSRAPRPEGRRRRARRPSRPERYPRPSWHLARSPRCTSRCSAPSASARSCAARRRTSSSTGDGARSSASCARRARCTRAGSARAPTPRPAASRAAGRARLGSLAVRPAARAPAGGGRAARAAGGRGPARGDGGARVRARARAQVAEPARGRRTGCPRSRRCTARTASSTRSRRTRT